MMPKKTSRVTRRHQNTKEYIAEIMQGTPERKNPRDGANVLSIIFIQWMQDLLSLGNKRPLTDNDLFPLLEDYKAELLMARAQKCWLDELKNSDKENKKPQLWKALIKLIPWRSGLAMIVLRILWSLSFVLLPLSLWVVLKELNDGTGMDIKRASMYVALLALISIVKAVSTPHYDYITELWALKLKVAVIGLVYKKVLSLNRYGLESKLSGNIINLVSNDAQKVEKFLNHLGMIMCVPLELTISLVILWYLVGWEAFIGAAFFFILMAVQVVMARNAANLRYKAAAFTDQRLAVMNEIISGIRAVKMYAWEWNFKEILYYLRRKEMAIIRLKGIIVSLLIVLYYTIPPVAGLISVTILALMGAHLSSFVIFTLVISFVTMRFIFCVNLSQILYQAIDAKVALDRVQVFLKETVSNSHGIAEQLENSPPLSGQENPKDKLFVQFKGTKKMPNYRGKDELADECSVTFVSNAIPVANKETAASIMDTCVGGYTSALGSTDENIDSFISISDASFSWNEGHYSDTLSSITLNISGGELFAVTGAVGSGKSSLLTAILGELPLRNGSVSFRGKVAYVPQIPWVFSGTVRENILFGLSFDEKRFQHVVHVCSLTKDLNDFVNGDLTEIGQRGVTLSGGQKARVGLARAVYSNADIFLLDDPLSAVDTKVGGKLFESCILGELSGRVRLLATHQLQYLTKVDRIAVLEKGSITHLGGYEELREKGAFHGIVELSEPSDKETARSLEKDSLELSVLTLSDQGTQESSLDCLDVKKSSALCQDGSAEPKLSESLRLVSVVDDSEEESDEKLLGKSSPSLVLSEKECGLLDELEITELERDGTEITGVLEHSIRELFAHFSFERGERESLLAFFEMDKSLADCQEECTESKFTENSQSASHTVKQSDEGRLLGESCTKPLLCEEENDSELAELQVDEASSPERVCLIGKQTDQRPVRDLKESEEQKSSGTVTWRLYWRYLNQGVPAPMIILVALLLIVGQAPNWWLAKMVEMSREDQKAPVTQLIHGCLVFASIFFMAVSSLFFYYILLKASENLHNKMANATIKAPVLFFDTNPAGRILNRFAKDIGSMDDVLPPIFLQALQLCLSSIGAILVPAATNYWLFLALLPIIAIYVYFGKYFLKSSRELKRIEAIRCSPVYSHITETVNGLEIVHSSNMNKTFLDRLQRYQDENTQAFFLVLSCNRWLALRLDLLSSLFVTCVAFGAILLTENPALAGLALSYALQTLNGTQYGVRLSSEVENWMTSVERVFTYTEIEAEPGYSTDTRPSESWPDRGDLNVQDLSLVYFEGGPLVLKDISFCVKSKEKVGVVGRTGAGKSSLVSALFRMPEPVGKVLIDGVDITSLSIQEARRSMAVITQDPVLFGGSLKKNMDPFSQYTDQQLWTALEEVQLKTVVKDLPGQLNFRLRESGTNLSVGERQLVCLARALVQRSKIIIMDEATANVDFKTDHLIQEVIRHKFKDSTVLTIAHRLNTIMDYDKVLVLDGGRVVEFDNPDVLIRNGGLFAEMVKSHNQSVKS